MTFDLGEQLHGVNGLASKLCCLLGSGESGVGGWEIGSGGGKGVEGEGWWSGGEWGGGGGWSHSQNEVWECE